MKLNLEGRKELRKYVEEFLAKVPEGKRVKINDDVLQTLLFETIIIPYNEDKVKIPVWSGSFLRKIDLSKVSFCRCRMVCA